MEKKNDISLHELRARLRGNGLVTEGEGVFHCDHILVMEGEGGRLIVRAVASNESDGRRVVDRLANQLLDAANVEIQTGPNPLKNAS